MSESDNSKFRYDADFLMALNSLKIKLADGEEETNYLKAKRQLDHKLGKGFLVCTSVPLGFIFFTLRAKQRPTIITYALAVGTTIFTVMYTNYTINRQVALAGTLSWKYEDQLRRLYPWMNSVPNLVPKPTDLYQNKTETYVQGSPAAYQENTTAANAASLLREARSFEYEPYPNDSTRDQTRDADDFAFKNYTGQRDWHMDTTATKESYSADAPSTRYSFPEQEPYDPYGLSRKSHPN